MHHYIYHGSRPCSDLKQLAFYQKDERVEWWSAFSLMISMHNHIGPCFIIIDASQGGWSARV